MLSAMANAPDQWQDAMAYNSSNAFANLCGLQDVAPGQQDSTALAITQSIVGAGTGIAQAILQAKAMKFQAEQQARNEALAHKKAQAGGFGFGDSNSLLTIVGIGLIAVIGYSIYKKKG